MAMTITRGGETLLVCQVCAETKDVNEYISKKDAAISKVEEETP